MAAPLLDDELAGRYRGEWHAIQTEFVDEPRRAVARADELVGDLMQRLADGFAEERRRLEAQWDDGGDERATTEELRLALRHYREFFARLLEA